MAGNPRAIKGRIGNVANISQITKAMNTIAMTKVMRMKRRLETARPYGDDLETLLSKQVGPFERADLLPQGDNYVAANYRAGELEVYAELGVNDSAEDAQEGLATARENTPSDEVVEAWSKGTDPSFFKAGGVFMVWTRGRYFFVAHAKSEAGLDAFMKAFPY